MSFITSGAWARPVQDASTALVEGGAMSFSFENDVAEDIYYLTNERAASCERWFITDLWTIDSAIEAGMEIEKVFQSAAALDMKEGVLAEDEATIALMALNLASGSDYAISSSEALDAKTAVKWLKVLLKKECRWNQNSDEYCTERGTSTDWGRLFERARDVLYSPNQECEPAVVKALGLLFVFHGEEKWLDKNLFKSKEESCQNSDEKYAENLERANEYLTTAIGGLTKFYPQYWR